MHVHRFLRQAAWALAVPSAGCATAFHEAHYFKGGKSDDAGPGTNYYRVRVTGCTTLFSSRYVSGYFDPDAVDTYFNKISQPTGAALRPEAEAGKAAGAGEEAQLRPVSPSLADKDLVLILSTNSEEIANQIGALAANEQFTAALAGLAAQRDFADATEAEYRLRSTQARATSLAQLAQQTVGGLAGDTDLDAVRQAALTVLNRLAYDMGVATSFADLAQAADWFERNRGRLDEGGGR